MNVIKTARNVVSDMGVEQARNIGGLLDLAQCSLTHPERDANKVLTKELGLALPIPLRTIEIPPASGKSNSGESKGCLVERLKLQDWAEFILSCNSWHMLCGLTKPDRQREEAIWTAFWAKFQTLEPGHEIFELAAQGKVNLAKAAGILLHGDEGRGRRRQAFTVLSFHSVLGKGTRASTSKDTRRVKKQYLKMKLNYKGHTYATRLLSAVWPLKLQHAHEECFSTLLQAAYEDARYMATTGVEDFRGQRYHMVLLGTVADWPFLHKAGKLRCTFANVVKRVDQVAGRICHLCEAGPHHTPWEQIATRNPAWAQTLNLSSPFDKLPPASVVPHSPGLLANHFRFDVFHCWHLGVGRNFAGSFLALLSCQETASNVDERFQQLTERYKAWCLSSGHSPLVSKITKELLGWTAMTEFPTAGWYKADITTTMLEFFESFPGPFTDPLLQLALEAAKAINGFFRILYSSDVWISPADAHTAAQLLFKFLRRYEQCARAAHDEDRPLFILQPKCHPLHHMAWDLLQRAKAGMESMSPLAFSCQMSEDFIGRPSRLSRRVTARGTVKRVIQRYLQSAYTKWREAGLLVDSS